jgi:hypothetical protein
MSTKLDRSKVRKGVVHHLGDSQGPCKSVTELLKRSNPGYEFPAYDFGILDDGTIVELRPLTYVGAHCIASKQKYIYGPNWWNENSIGVVLAIDNTKFQPSQAMVNGLIVLMIRLCKSQNMTIDDWYPHFQLTATACPGGSYNKLGFDTGYFDYDVVEKAVYRGEIPAIAPTIVPTPILVPIPISAPAPVPTPVPITPSVPAIVDTKTWMESKSIMGGVVVVLASVAGAMGLALDANTQSQILDYATVIVTAIGGLIAIYGRVKASKIIK